MAVFNYTKQQLKDMSWFVLKRQLEYAKTDYNKMNNTPSKVTLGISAGIGSDAWTVTEISEDFQIEAKQLVKEHMKKAIDLMQKEFEIKTAEEIEVVLEESDYDSIAELRFNNLMDELANENKRKFMEDANNEQLNQTSRTME